MILIRFILIFLIVYLLLRGFIRSLSLHDSSTDRKNDQKFRDTPEKQNKKISRSIGEYVDYEETKKKD
jgi:flagellar biosynthesis/type III secretory pathway M-ring protein FliF/YscJ